jgi:hypothetical protein
MKWIEAISVSLLIFGVRTVSVKKIDRGVFVSARELAASCQVMKDAVGEDYVLGPVQGGRSFARPATSDMDMAPVGRCMGYIEGVADEFREPVGSHHPFSAGRGELPILIHAFLKRLADHPEEADFAASTVLHEADKDVLDLCGDCSFGMLVYRPH